MARTTLTLSSKNYSSWSLRGWLMTKLAGIDFDEVIVAPDDADARAEILLLSPSILVPCLTYEGIKIWDTLAIGEFLNEIAPKAGLLPKDRAKRAHCRSVSRRDALRLRIAAPGVADEHQGAFFQFQGLVEGQGRHRPDRGDLATNASRVDGGPFLFGEISMADAMYAPVVSRFRTYGVTLEPALQAYADRIWDLPAMTEWREAALLEKEEIEELEVEF